MKNTPDVHALESYRRQMMELYRQATPSSTSETTDDNWLDSRYPEPNIEKDKAVVTLPQPEVIPDTGYVGYLRVYAFTGGGAEPIPGARAIVTRVDEQEQTIYANLITDRDGFTPIVALPTVDPALSLRPGDALPYVTYAVRVTADGFQSVEHRNIPIYGDNYVTQPVAMLPLLPPLRSLAGCRS